MGVYKRLITFSLSCDGQICMGLFQRGSRVGEDPNHVADFLGGWVPLCCRDFNLKMFHFAVVV